MNIRVGQVIPIEADKRYIQHVRSHAIGDVYDALVELITNADDSYNRLFVKKKRSRDGGDILIEHMEQRKVDCAPPTGEFSSRFEGGATGSFCC